MGVKPIALRFRGSKGAEVADAHISSIDSLAVQVKQAGEDLQQEALDLEGGPLVLFQPRSGQEPSLLHKVAEGMDPRPPCRLWAQVDPELAIRQDRGKETREPEIASSSPCSDFLETHISPEPAVLLFALVISPKMKHDIYN